MSAIDALIRQKEAEMVSIKSQPRRSCSIPDPFRTSPDVLGKVCVCVFVCVCVGGVCLCMYVCVCVC